MAGILGGGFQWWEQVPAHQDLGMLLVTVLPVWIFGALIGLLVWTASDGSVTLRPVLFARQEPPASSRRLLLTPDVEKFTSCLV